MSHVFSAIAGASFTLAYTNDPRWAMLAVFLLVGAAVCFFAEKHL